jgi:hypothetical protein
MNKLVSFSLATPARAPLAALPAADLATLRGESLKKEIES